MQKDSKISRSGNKLLEQYTTIYCGAHLQRLKEIWQYIMVINTAASTYMRENVYNYDITFRHLMAFNPNRSWAVTYNQMCNLSMRDPLPKNGFNQKAEFTHYSNGVTSKPNQGGSKKKSDYYWNFIKGIPCKFGSKCKYIERCKYCDSPSHGVNACGKLQKKTAESGVTKPVQESGSLPK